jgi:DNA-binding LacI/PurR family transcriptional regulator
MEQAAQPLKIKDVALRAGVSPATVSRVLNGFSTVSEANRQLVLDAVRELGYRPNGLARNLRRRQLGMIGVLVSDIENPHFSAMVRAVEDAAYRAGKRVLLCNTDENPEKQRRYVEVLASERVMGAIVVATDPGAAELSELLDLDICVVAFDRVLDDPRADAVLIDDHAGAVRATRHLINAGHSRIGMVGGPQSVPTGVDRVAGYEAAMHAAGLEPIDVDGNFRIDGGHAAAEQLLAEHPDLTGLVVANNLMALGALEVLRARGAAGQPLPALVAIDDPFWAPMVEPALTTLAQPIREMSESAVDLLFERIDQGRREPRRLVFDFELRVRDSCRTQPAGAWRKEQA